MSTRSFFYFVAFVIGWSFGALHAADEPATSPSKTAKALAESLAKTAGVEKSSQAAQNQSEQDLAKAKQALAALQKTLKDKSLPQTVADIDSRLEQIKPELLTKYEQRESETDNGKKQTLTAEIKKLKDEQKSLTTNRPELQRQENAVKQAESTVADKTKTHDEAKNEVNNLKDRIALIQDVTQKAVTNPTLGGKTAPDSSDANAVANANALADINKFVIDQIKANASKIRTSARLDTRDLPELIRLYHDFIEKTSDTSSVDTVLQQSAALRTKRNDFISNTIGEATFIEGTNIPIGNSDAAAAWTKVFAAVDQKILAVEATKDVKEIRAAHDAVLKGLLGLQTYEKSRGLTPAGTAQTMGTAQTAGGASSAAISNNVAADLKLLFGDGVPYARSSKDLKRKLKARREIIRNLRIWRE